MRAFISVCVSFWRYRIYTLLGILFHIFTAIFTVVSIPLVIPFFQILFGISPSRYKIPESAWELEGWLNYGFSRLIAMSDHFIALKVVCGLVIIVFLLKNLFRFLTSFFMIYVRNGVLRDLRNQLWHSFEGLSLSQRGGYAQGYLMQLSTNDLNEVDHGILKVFEFLFKLPLIIVGSLLIMLWLSPQLTMIAFGLIAFTLVVIGGLSYVLKRQSASALEVQSNMTVLLDQYLSSMKLVKIHHADGYFGKRYQKENEDYFKLSNKILRRRDLASPLAEFLGVVTIVVLLYFGAHAVFNDDIQAATFFAFIFAFYNVIDPAKSFSREYANLQRGIAALDRVQSFIEQHPSDPLKSESSTGNPTKGLNLTSNLNVASLSFKHNEEQKYPLTDINVRLGKGEKIGVIGKSGAGKTTLVDLILRFHEGFSGNISIDGRSIDRIDVADYRSMFGLVAQDSVLFFGTVKENILLNHQEDTKRLHEVLAKVAIPLKYLDKKVGDRATLISGGEAQRICLARVLYHNPDIIILDEPTSHLDAPTEQVIIKSILNSEKTVLMITHNVQLLQDMDHIIVLDKGQIESSGSFNSLLENSRIFRHLLGMNEKK